MNEIALKYWHRVGYTTDDVSRVCSSLNHVLAARFSFHKDGGVSVVLSKQAGDTRQGHFPVCIKLMEQIANSWSVPRPTGSIIVWLEDGMWDAKLSSRAPIFAFGRFLSDGYSLLMPDPAFLGGHAYAYERKEMERVEADLPWAEKKPTVFWRGASSGLSPCDLNNWYRQPRIRLALASKRLGNPEKLDAYISRVKDYGGRFPVEKLHEDGLVRPECEFKEFLRYRYLVDVPGDFCAWKSQFLKLCSTSTVLLVENDLCQWYYDKLRPWVHYVPIRRDLSDIEQIVDWVRENDDRAREIAATASSVMRSITWESEFEALSNQIRQVLGCCKS